ncbi:hypothetical protein AWZ03_006906 [Drosophila navojoa]|uniref:Uncharacterized protein n=1 Tax=Drosophila navojoa TaxID=7232 RepID=A0A484BD00_DRONA|nr:hypothetical protein AWZ03_006906 [Drosophila navojoa]
MAEESKPLDDWHEMVEALPQVSRNRFAPRTALMRFQQRRPGHGHGHGHGNGVGRGHKHYQKKIASLAATMRHRKRPQCCKRCYNMLMKKKQTKRLVKQMRAARTRRLQSSTLDL